MPIFSKPLINYCKEEDGTLYLTISHKSEKCGFIDISKEKGQVKFQFACGWIYSAKGISKLKDIDFVYKNEHLTLALKTTKRKIFKLKCERQIFDKIIMFCRNE